MAARERREHDLKRLVTALTAVLALAGAAFGQTLTVWTTFQNISLEWLREQADAFSDGFGIDVEVVPFDVNELKQKALVGAPEGAAGDVFVGVPHEQVGEMVEGGILLDMTDYVTSAYLADLSDQARLGLTVGGRLFGLPLSVEGPALVVNDDLVARVPRTYDELLATAEELTTPDTFGFMFDDANFYFAYAWLKTFGGYVFGRDASGALDTDDVGLANEGAVAGAEALRELRFGRDLIPPGTDFEIADGLFADGALAMIYTGPWSIPGYLAAGLDFTVVPVPPLADGTPFSGFMEVIGAVVNQYSGLGREAANFAKWVSRPEAQVSLASLSGRIPASLSALEQVQADPVIAGFGAALLDAEPMPNVPEMGAVWQPMARALTTLLEDEDADVAATLSAAVDDILHR